MKYSGFHRALEIDRQGHRHKWQVHVCNEIEADQLDLFRENFKKKNLKAPSYTAIVIKAIAIAVDENRGQFPQINSYIKSVFGFKKIHIFDGISGGCSTALDTEEGVALGVVLEPQKKSLLEITQELSTFSNNDSPGVKNVMAFYRMPYFLQKIAYWVGEWSAALRYQHRGTFCINPVGKFGIDYHLTLPQTSSLQFGMGTIRDRIVARDSKPCVVKTFYLTVSFDRRLMNGRPVAMLMERVRQILNRADFKN